MHHIHTTDGLVIGSKPYGEAGKIVFIFTSKLGLITAIAQGVRLEKSKLRYNIRDYHFASFSLVHGKEFWRIVGASELHDLHSKEKEKVRLAILAPVALILRRLLHGEEVSEQLFQCLVNCVKYIEKSSDFIEQEIVTIESLTIARILHLLGYLNADSLIKEEIKTIDYNHDLISRLIPKRLEINKKINQALRESHL